LYCTKSGWSCIWSFSSGVGLKFAQSSKANGKQSLIPEETYQTLLTNKKQRNLEKVHAANIIKPSQTHINWEKYTICLIKLKTGSIPYLGLELTMHVLKS
jgi:hypothetical protein